eukprot:scaffold10949_cov67-Phaeocystis_antarctica.AAC.8
MRLNDWKPTWALCTTGYFLRWVSQLSSPENIDFLPLLLNDFKAWCCDRNQPWRRCRYLYYGANVVDGNSNWCEADRSTAPLRCRCVRAPPVSNLLPQAHRPSSNLRPSGATLWLGTPAQMAASGAAEVACRRSSAVPGPQCIATAQPPRIAHSPSSPERRPTIGGASS